MKLDDLKARLLTAATLADAEETRYGTMIRQAAQAITDLEAIKDAAIALRDDMLMRAERDKWQNDGELVVEAGAGVWSRLNIALAKLEKARG